MAATKHRRPPALLRTLLSADAGSFVRGWSLDRLARLQGVDPLRDPAVLAGGWPEDDDVDEALAEIYRQRD